MDYIKLHKKLNQLRIEDFIWFIYIGIIFLSWYSNNLERKYFIYNDLISKKNYRETMIFIFSILIIVYFYFVKDSYDDVRNLTIYDTDEKIKLTYISFIGSILIAISGIIFLYIAIKDKEIEVELAFN